MHAQSTPAKRPAWFDAKMLSYRKGLFALARRRGYVGDEADDLVNDVFVRCLANWQSYREEGSFFAYLHWAMRGIIAENKRRRACRPVLVGAREDVDVTATMPSQEHYAELSLALSRLQGRNGTVVLRQAMGDDLAEIGREIGVSRERARQLAEAERLRLAKMGLAA